MPSLARPPRRNTRNLAAPAPDLEAGRRGPGRPDAWPAWTDRDVWELGPAPAFAPEAPRREGGAR